MTKEIKDKDIVDYYKGKNIRDADILLLKTAENNYEKGYANAQEEILELLDEWWEKTMQISSTSTRLEKLKKSITQSQTNTKVVEE